MAHPTADPLVPLPSLSDLELLIRNRVRDLLETILDEEIQSALGASAYERGAGRRGYRHGRRPARRLVTSLGPVDLASPRARLRDEEGSTEFQSEILPRYERRTRRVDAALITSYLAGANTRKVRLALGPLLEGTALSRSAVSRVVKRLEELKERWRHRDLGKVRFEVLVLDAIRLPVRLARRVVRVPVQAVLGVRENGERELLELRLAPSESLRAWEGVLEGLVARGLMAPRIAVVDGNKGLLTSLRQAWPETKIQRCTQHKLKNLLARAPKHCHRELTRDYGTITHAENRRDALRAYEAFARKWRRLVPEVVTSIEEAGTELLSFYSFPPELWKALRTTNQIERLNGEFRRRVKTQGSFPTESAAVTMLYGLLAAGMIRLRKIDRHDKLREVVEGRWKEVA